MFPVLSMLQVGKESQMENSFNGKELGERITQRKHCS